MSQCMITTFDNPFNPFVDFDNWFRFDCDKGYYSCAYLGRVAVTNDKMTTEEENAAIEEAIDEIISCDFLHIYKKVKSDDNVADSKHIDAKSTEKQAVPA